MAVIGYIRVSTDKQTCEHQKYEIKQFAKAQKKQKKKDKNSSKNMALTCLHTINKGIK